MKTVKQFFINSIILLVALLSSAAFTLAATASAGPSAEPQQKVYYFLHDNLGGISAVTDEEGNVVERRDYLPFGSDRLIPDAQFIDYGFTGKEQDPETELYYYGARYYDPFTGRFISPDPLLNALDTMNQQELNAFLSDPQHLNTYSYARNNPLRYIDPTGEFEDDVHFNLTFFLGNNAGLSFFDAFDIALANQGMDEDPESQPFSSVEAREQYHFPTQDQLKNLLTKAMTTLDNQDIGTFFHANQDKYAHHGYGPLIGHFFSLIFPDKTWSSKSKVKLSDMMAKESFFYMRVFNRLKNGTNGLSMEEYDQETETKWEGIQERAHNFNKATNFEDKMKALYPEHYDDKKSDKKK